MRLGGVMVGSVDVLHSVNIYAADVHVYVDYMHGSESMYRVHAW